MPEIAALSSHSCQCSFVSRTCARSASLIGVGLLVLAMATCWPQVPAVTGMALVALGATAASIARFRRTTALLPISLLHVAIYGGLYALFVGATLHATAASAAGIGLPTVIDLAVSIWPVAAALLLVVAVLRDAAATE